MAAMHNHDDIHVKIEYPKSVRRDFLGCRAVNPWISLPSEVVQAPSLNSFKARLDKHWERYQYETDVKGILHKTNSISRTDLSSYI